MALPNQSSLTLLIRMKKKRVSRVEASCPKCRCSMTKRKKQQGVCPNCGISFKLYAAQQAAIEKKTVLEESKAGDDYSALSLQDKVLLESAIWSNFSKGILCECINDSREVSHKYKIGIYAVKGLKLAGLGVGAFAAILLSAEISRRFFDSPSDSAKVGYSMNTGSSNVSFSAQNKASRSSADKPTARETMIFCASQDDVFKYQADSTEEQKESDRRICRKFRISSAELDKIYIKVTDNMGGKIPCNF